MQLKNKLCRILNWCNIQLVHNQCSNVPLSPEARLAPALYQLAEKILKYFPAVLILFVIINKNVFSQCQDVNMAFTEGEVLKYSVYYNWGFIWLNAGWVEFKVKPYTYLDKPVYHLDSYGASRVSYDWIFKVRDRYQTYLDKETFLPLWFHRENFEGGFEVDNKYFFDWNNKQAVTFTENSKRSFKQDTVQLKDCTYDVLSLIYYCRNLNFSALQVNDTIPVVSIIDNEIFDLYIRYLGHEKLADRNGHEYNTIKFSALLVEGTIFKGGEDLIVWVTDDKNRVPVLVEAKILVGSVKAYFEKASGLKSPMAAKIK